MFDLCTLMDFNVLYVSEANAGAAAATTFCRLYESRPGEFGDQFIRLLRTTAEKSMDALSKRSYASAKVSRMGFPVASSLNPADAPLDHF